MIWLDITKVDSSPRYPHSRQTRTVSCSFLSIPGRNVIALSLLDHSSPGSCIAILSVLYLYAWLPGPGRTQGESQFRGKCRRNRKCEEVNIDKPPTHVNNSWQMQSKTTSSSPVQQYAPGQTRKDVQLALFWGFPTNRQR